MQSEDTLGAEMQTPAMPEVVDKIEPGSGRLVSQRRTYLDAQLKGFGT